MADETKTGASLLEDSELKGAKERLGTLLEENERIQTNEIKVEEKTDEGDGGVGYKISPEAAAAYRKNLAEAKGLREVIELTEGTLELKQYLNAPSRASMAILAEAVQQGVTGGMREVKDPLGGKTVGQVFMESDEWKLFREAGGLNMPKEWKVDGLNLGDQWIRPLERKDVYTATGGTQTIHGFGQVQTDPLVPLRHRTVRIRDLFPVVQTNATLIDFMTVSGFTNAASPVPERNTGDTAFALKPQSAFEFTPKQAPVRTIAHWEVAHRNVLDDEPQLQGILNNELLYGLRLAEDDQVLNGAGTSEDLLGILNTPGIQTYGYAVAGPISNKADAFRRAATLGMLAYYEMTGAVAHPYDWEELELLKDTTGNYIVATSVAAGGPPTLWRMPLVETPAMPQNTALVGAFGLGATLYDRMSATIRIAEQHSDFFVRNAVVILAEQRLALAVKRPEAFVKITGL